MGKRIYLTDKEILALVHTCGEWSEIMSEGEDTFECVEDRLKDGLGSALKKLYKGRNGYNTYKDY